MGDISIIARRLGDGHVQYGWSGNGGYFSNVGRRLLAWYNDSELIEYLFSLGELRLIGKPNSENGMCSFMETHSMTGVPHSLGTTEREIFSKIMFIDYGYFYDLDEHWYYIIPGPFRIKIRLELIANNLNESGDEFDFLKENIERKLLDYIVSEYRERDLDFKELCSESLKGEIKEIVSREEFPIHVFWEKYRALFSYFDDWVVVTTDEETTKVTGFKIRPKMDKREETIEW